MSSEKMPSRFHSEHEKKTFEKFGLIFDIYTITESRPEWRHLYTDQDGNEIDVEDKDVVQQIKDGKIRPVVDWVETGELLTSTYVDFVEFRDYEKCKKACRVELYVVPEGPIMGIVVPSPDKDYVRLLDPCLIVYNGTRVDYRNIFNVARHLDLHKSGIRSRQAPAEIVVAGYPGFVLQNRMFKYQLKPAITMAATPELTNEAVELNNE